LDAAAAYRFVSSPITMSNAAVSLRRIPPRLGEHTEEVLATLGPRETARTP
jgi:crotonobetainyl-CoA:carnitine CoA-transferase CaiB-like acyl-CoA transferase